MTNQLTRTERTYRYDSYGASRQAFRDAREQLRRVGAIVYSASGTMDAPFFVAHARGATVQVTQSVNASKSPPSHQLLIQTYSSRRPTPTIDELIPYLRAREYK